MYWFDSLTLGQELRNVPVGIVTFFSANVKCQNTIEPTIGSLQVNEIFFICRKSMRMVQNVAFSRLFKISFSSLSSQVSDSWRKTISLLNEWCFYDFTLITYQIWKLKLLYFNYLYNVQWNDIKLIDIITETLKLLQLLFRASVKEIFQSWEPLATVYALSSNMWFKLDNCVFHLLLETV